MSGLDDLQDLTKPIVGIMHRQSSQPVPDIDAAVSRLEGKTEANLPHWGLMLKELGLIEASSKHDNTRRVTRAIAASAIRHMAQLHRRLDVLRPLPDLSSQQRTDRQDAWDKIADQFRPTEQAAPIHSVFAA